VLSDTLLGTDGQSIQHMTETPDATILVVTRLIEPILEEAGFELVDIEYLSKHGRWVLRIYMDRNNGVTIDDCAWMSGEIGDRIDLKEIFQHEYVLEVSSPGPNRRLRKDRDFLNAVGKKVKVKLVSPVKGRRNFTGYLQGFRDKTLYLEMEDYVVPFCLPDVEKVNLVYEF